jgi:hypothetical protein
LRVSATLDDSMRLVASAGCRERQISLSVVAEGVRAGEGLFELVRAAESARLLGQLQDALLAGEVRLDGDNLRNLARSMSRGEPGPNAAFRWHDVGVVRRCSPPRLGRPRSYCT